MDVLRLELLMICMLQHVFYCSTRCRFPKPWRGHWWQGGGLGSVHIKSGTIEHKGRCLQHIQDYYVLENTENDCYQCLLLMNPHVNILQYKQSFCESGVSPHVVCSRITVENMLFIMVREDPPLSTLTCPFSPQSYHFTYSDDFTTHCDTAISSLHPCVDQHTYHLRFKHCNQQAVMNNQDIELSCLAHWKQGSDFYMYGKLTGNTMNDYRCFLYHKYGSSIHMSMSADTTCRGIRSYNDGPIRFTFTQDDVFTSTCRLPSWFSSSPWRDLSGHEVYTPTRRQPTQISVTSSDTWLDRDNRLVECIQLINSTDNRIILLSKTTRQCSTNYECIHITRTHPEVSHIYTSELDVGVDAMVQSCTSSDIIYDTTHTLIPLRSSSQSTPCPLQGHYTLLRKYNTDICLGYLEFGCARSSSHLKIMCNGESSVLQCQTSWTESGRIFLIAVNKNHPQKHGYCFKISYGHEEGYMNRCHNRKLNNIGYQNDVTKMDYTFSWTPQPCQSESSSTQIVTTTTTRVTTNSHYATQHNNINQIQINAINYKYLNKSEHNTTSKLNSVTHKYVAQMSHNSGGAYFNVYHNLLCFFVLYFIVINVLAQS